MSQERTDNLFASESWTAVYTAFTNISLKAYDFDTIREALLTYTAQTYPDKFNDFIASSEFVAILDLVAYLGHSLSYRLDMNTRENFMDTAERRASILQMAKTLGYNKTRPINAKGFMKITSLSTDENVYDNLGVSLAGKTVNWNDSNDIDWYENFISVLNSAFSSTTKIQNPTSTLTVVDVEHSLYEINETASTKNVNYSFSANVDGKTRNFEAVRVSLDTVNATIQEDEPKLDNNFTIINRNDNLGSASDRTGFFVYAVAGALGFEDFTYNTQISNRIESINENNISNSDVWIQKIDTNRDYASSVTKVDNETRETAIYNSLRTGSGDIVSVNSADNNTIQLHYPDGVFGNAAYGNYRVWRRTVDNDNFSVNANDISNKTITIPYTGSDNRTYRLSLTISSTKDFSENFSGETYASVRRVAPRSYYAQDRMVNAQDYNVYPLTLGNNVVNKVKAVNTSFAGNSRFYETDDVLGHHSNLSITGSDGSVFVEDEEIKISLNYNRSKETSDNFIRNDIANAIKHPSLLNKFLHTAKESTRPVTSGSFVVGVQYIILVPGDTDFTLIGATDSVAGTVFTATGVGVGTGTAQRNGDMIFKNIATSKEYTIVTSSDEMKIITTDTPTGYVREGDTVELLTGSTTTIWADVKAVSTTTNTNDTLTLNKKIPEAGELITTIKGFRTKFEPTEITTIKTKIDDYSDTFPLYYTYTIVPPATTPTWNWSLTSSIATDVSVDINYKAGIRDTDTEYTAEFTGKKIAFESRDQVKFFYGNTTDVIDNETNLSQRDTIFLSYLSTSASGGTSTSVDDEQITIGQVLITDSNPIGTNGAEFNAVYENTGARASLEFADSDIIEGSTNYTHHLITPDGAVLPQSVFSTSNITGPVHPDPDWVIGHTLTNATTPLPLDTLDITITDLSTLTSAMITMPGINGATNPVTMGSSTATNLSSSNVDFEEGGNVSTTAYTIKSTQQLDQLGFKGNPSTSYFNSGKFTWRDLVEDGSQYDTTTAGTAITYDSTTTNYTFTLNPADSEHINVYDTGTGTTQNDVYFKQEPYGEIIINTTEALTTSNLALKNPSKTDPWINNANIQLKDEDSIVSNQWRIIFWTEEVIPSTTLIEVYVGSAPSVSDLETFSVRVKATFDITSGTTSTTTAYKSIASYVYDDYITPAGYIDNTKVKLLTSDTSDNPLAILDVTFGESVVLEAYVNNNIAYERVSNKMIAASSESLVPTTADIYYNTTDTIWKIRGDAQWVDLTAMAGAFVIGTKYEILDPGTTDFTLIGAADSIAGTVFTADGVGTGTGTAKHRGPTITYYDIKYKVVEGLSSVEDPFSSFRWEHYADLDKRIDPSTSNIVDMYVLSSDYVRNVNKWIATNFTTTTPTPPNNYELAKIMDSIEPKAAMADHVAYIPVQFKYLFGSYAEAENQAVFKVIKKLGVGYSDSEIKTAVSTKVNEYFVIDNWDFGATFYFSELAAYLHKELGDYISSIVIVPKVSTTIDEFTNLLSISCALNEIFMAVTTSSDVKIITQLAQSELVGE